MQRAVQCSSEILVLFSLFIWSLESSQLKNREDIYANTAGEIVVDEEETGEENVRRARGIL